MFIINLIKLSRPRTWFFIILSFVIGWLLTGKSLTFDFFKGIFVFIILVANVNLVNAYTDQEEDRMNLPHRIKMFERVGERKLVYSVIFLYILASLIALTMPFWFFVVYLISFFDTVFYSIEPLRFKKNPLSSLVSFSGAVALPLLGGWTLTENIFNIPNLIFFLGYWFLTYGTVKNLPDYEGDKRAGLRTTASVFNSIKRATQVTMTLLLSTYVVLAILLFLEFIEYKFVALFSLLPLIFLITYKMLQTEDRKELEKLHTYAVFYANSYLSLTILLISFSIYLLLFIAFIFFLQFLIVKTKFDSR